MNQVAGSQQPAVDQLDQLSKDGYLILPGLLPAEDCDALVADLTTRFEQQQSFSRKTIGGVRNLLRASPPVSAVAASEHLISRISHFLGGPAFPVRAILFDKTAGANWSVPWHQDLVVAVAKRIETPGFGPWSVKEGVMHVQPPGTVLENMLAIRLHLDDCHAGNGALRVIPGSHLGGELGTDEINAWVARTVPVVCEVPRGGALLMRPLLLHASSAAQDPLHRRIVHLEYAAVELPNGLRWFER